MERLTFDGLFCDIAKCDSTPGGTFCESGTCTQRRVWERLKEYENTGLEPEEIERIVDVYGRGHTLRTESAERMEIVREIKADRLRELVQAEQDGRLVVLPCAIGSEVFTIEESYFDCENCEHGAKAKYDPEINRRCCGLDDSEHCPYYIGGHIVKGFTIRADDADKPSISAPGKWGYEGLETFFSIDGKWYPTREEAEAALAQEGGSNEQAGDH